MARRRIRTIGMKKQKNFFIFIIYIGWDFSLSSKKVPPASNPSVMITGVASPAGMLPKFYKADR